MKPMKPLLAAFFASFALSSPPSPILYYPNWKYVGCITSSGAPERILSGFSPLNTKGNAIEDCLVACATGYAALASGYVKFSMKLHHDTDRSRSCYCANDINGLAPYAIQEDTVCDFPCARIPAESCGGSFDPKIRLVKAISLYGFASKSNSSAAVTTQATGATVAGSKMLGVGQTTSSGLQIPTAAVALAYTGGAAKEPSPRSIAGISVALFALAAAFLIGS
jgi:hypothetical protein